MHGLLGTQENWKIPQRILKKRYTELDDAHNKSNSSNLPELELYFLDSRNHGFSPHTQIHSYSSQLSDLFRFISKYCDFNHPIILVGHSMGGRVAMLAALLFPLHLSNPINIDSICIVDSAPVSYQHTHSLILQSLASLPLSDLQNKVQAQEILHKSLYHLNRSEINYLLSNLIHDNTTTHGGWRWKPNLKVLMESQNDVQKWPLEQLEDSRVLPKYNNRAIFVGSKDSGRMNPPHIDQISTHFTNHQLHLFPGSHFVHTEHATEFTHILLHELLLS